MAFIEYIMPGMIFLFSTFVFLCLQSHILVAESQYSQSTPRLSSSKALTLARTAELELNKSSQESLQTAIAILEQLIGDQSFRRLQNDERIIIYMMLTTAYERSSNFKQEQALIHQLLGDEAFKPYWISLKTSLGESFLAQENLMQAAKVMKELLRTPQRRLSRQDFDKVAALHAKIERHAELKLLTANQCYNQKEYEKATCLYKYLFEAGLAHVFPQTLSKQSFQSFLDSLSSRLATCYFLQKKYDLCLKVFSENNPQSTSSLALQALAEKNLGNFDGAFGYFEKIAEPDDKILWEAFSCAKKCTKQKPEQALLQLLSKMHIEKTYPLFEKIVFYFLENNQPETACLILENTLPQQTHAELIEKSHWLYVLSTMSCLRQSSNIHSKGALWLCNQFLQRYPDSAHYVDALFQKALLFWQTGQIEAALEEFSIIERDHPHYTHRDEVLFFMGSAMQSLDQDAKPVFSELVLDFPASQYAAEAYYRIFSEQQYAAYDIQAISHLKKMPKSYADTYFGVLAAFFIAAADREESPQNGLSPIQIKTLNEVVTTLNNAIDQGNALASTLSSSIQPLFYARILKAQHERALTHYTLGNLNEVITDCDGIKNLIVNMKEEKPHLLYSQAAFLKSRTLLLQGNESQAREELSHLIEYAANYKCEKGDALVLALIEYAAQKSRDEDYSAAFSFLNKAQIVQATGCKEELLLEILIAKSQLHRKCGELDKAMMLLSSVINERSASSLRIQAMFLRSELYELKGRRDLAFRQLQTTAKKGGEWGQRASKKLEEKYGY